MKRIALFSVLLLVGCGGNSNEVVMPENPTAPPPPGSLVTDDSKLDGASINP
ncbi:MAG: hypothetical protein ACK58L_22060 [Planctomycetota bacterium]